MSTFLAQTGLVPTLALFQLYCGVGYVITSEVIVFIFKDLYVNVVTTLMKDVNQTKNIITVVYFIQVIQVILGSPGQRSLGICHLSLMPLDTY